MYSWSRIARRSYRRRPEITGGLFAIPFARDGGLLSYGVDQVDTWRRTATYVDRILRGAKPG
jgi:hypothetical protein